METYMVTKLSSTSEYISYIKEQVNLKLPMLTHLPYASNYEPKVNDSFGVSYIYKTIKISFTKDRLDFLLIVKNKNNIYPKNFKDLYANICLKIPLVDKKWETAISVNLIDYYIDYLKENIDKFEFEE